MQSIRLSRVGTKNAPSYRVVVMPKQRDPWAKVTEILGHYNPRRKPRELVLKIDRVKYWISQGAEVTDTVWNLLLDEKIVEGKKRSVTHISKTRRAKLGKEEEERKQKEVEAKAKAEAAKLKAEEEAKAKAEAEAAAKVAAAEAAKAEAEKPAEEKAPALEDKKEE